MDLKVWEIFGSIQGESSYVGLPTLFVRLSGCNLRCRYCDTVFAYEGGTEMSVEQVVEYAVKYGCPLVEITGGEPMIQEAVPKLASSLLNQGFDVLLETNGTMDIGVLPDGVIRIVDIKCPSSGEGDSFMWENLWKLTPKDEVKFVISDRPDYEWARGIIRDRFAMSSTNILLSTVFGELPPKKLVKWMLEDKIQARFQLQIHKFIWPHDATGV